MKVRTMRMVGLRPVAVDVEVLGREAGGMVVTGLPDPLRDVRLRGLLVRHGAVDLAREASFELRVAGGGGREVEAALYAAALAALGAAPVPDGAHVFGSVGQGGWLEPVRGIYAMVAALPAGAIAVVPVDQAGQARHANPGAVVFGAATVSDIAAAFANPAGPQVTAGQPARIVELPVDSFDDLARFDPVVVARVRDAAVAGKSILLVGPHGSGASMLARRVVGALPDPSAAELALINANHSAANLLPDGGVWGSRPCRTPHYTVSETGMLGGGTPVRPGEVTLAQAGVLLLLDLPEFRSGVLAQLAYALRKGEHVLVRNDEEYVLPARPRVVVATAATCSCQKPRSLEALRETAVPPCACPPERVAAYHRRYEAMRPCFDVVIELPTVRSPETP